MRVWLDGNLLNKYNLTPVDVINALQVQNDQIARVSSAVRQR